MRAGKNFRTIDKKTLDLLREYDWRGNIRELENFIKRAVIVSWGSSLCRPLGELQRMPLGAASTSNRTLAEAQRDHILEVLRETKWVLGGCQGAAARLGLPRTTLVYRMQKLGISREKPRERFRSSV